jgi:RNA polymerase sigma-70 factor (ECF subfamily)
MTDLDDSIFIAAARQGDLEAFSELVLRHQAAVRACLAVRINTPHDAEDLAQEVFVLAFQKLGEFDDSRPLAPWLHGFAMNLLRNYRRKFHRQKTATLEQLQELVDRQAEAAHEFIPEADRYAAMRECLQKLDNCARQLITARYQEDVGLAELCCRLGKKHSAVTMQLHRIRQQLRACIDLRLRAT